MTSLRLISVALLLATRLFARPQVLVDSYEADEIELQYRLSEESYNHLLEQLAEEERLIKTHRLKNYYFDTPDFDLDNAGLRLRLRTINGQQGLMTVKLKSRIRLQAEHPPKVRREIESPIPIATIKPLLLNPKRILRLSILPIDRLKQKTKNIDVSDLRVIGTVPKLRTLARGPQGTVLEIDRTDILGKTYYTVEVEVGREDRDSTIRKFFDKRGIEFWPTQKSTFRRLKERLSNE